MKRAFIILSILINCIAISFFARRIIFQRSQSTIDRYFMYTKQRETFLDTHIPEPGKILIIGDSHIELSPFNIVFKDCINRGVGGEKTGDLLRRLPIIFAANPRVVLISIGINNLRSREDPCKSIDSILAYCTVRCKVYMNAIMPLADSIKTTTPDADYINKKVIGVNNYIDSLHLKYPFTFIRMDRALSDGIALNEEYTVDGIHLNYAGYMVFIDSLKCHPEFILKSAIKHTTDNSVK